MRARVRLRKGELQRHPALPCGNEMSGGGGGGGGDGGGGSTGKDKQPSRGASEPDEHGGSGPGRRCRSVPLTDISTTTSRTSGTHGLPNSQVSFPSFS